MVLLEPKPHIGMGMYLQHSLSLFVVILTLFTLCGHTCIILHAKFVLQGTLGMEKNFKYMLTKYTLSLLAVLVALLSRSFMSAVPTCFNATYNKTTK